MTSEQVDEVVARLSEDDRAAILNAQAADVGEWWMDGPIGIPEIDGGDGVLTPLGLAVRQRLVEGER